MTTYHVDWNSAGYRLCADADCPEDFHSTNKLDCVREYDRVMLPVLREGGLDTIPASLKKTTLRAMYRAKFGFPPDPDRVGTGVLLAMYCSGELQ